MGGTFSIAVHARDRAVADVATSAAFTELRRLDRMLSHYRPDSEWSQLNRHGAERAVVVPPELFEVVSAALDYSRRSDGAFDITVGPLVRAWGFRDGTGRVASEREIEDARGRVGYAHVLLDAAHRTIRFDRPGVELDPGGIGKGYAVDRMVAVLKDRGIDRALVSAAGSSIYAIGTPPGEAGWPVRIGVPPDLAGAGQEHGRPAVQGRRAGAEDPTSKPPVHANAGVDAPTLLLQDESLSTSGASERFVRADGQVHSHVLDPRTGRPAAASLAAVVAPRTLDSEAWTKVVLVNGRDWSAQHTPRGWRVFLCEDERPKSCGWVRPSAGK